MPQGGIIHRFSGRGRYYITTDTIRLKRVLNNLINNAKVYPCKGITLGYKVDESG